MDGACAVLDLLPPLYDQETTLHLAPQAAASVTPY